MVTWNDFEKIWASTSPLTPYEFSDPNYSQGWNFVGSTPPARQMWDSIQKKNDEKFKYLRDNFGTPNIVTSSSQMTDTEKVYVYMGSEAGWNNGHWYYYNEGTSSWADGGVYNSVAFVTDTTLSIAGQPADAKAVGDALALKADLAGCTFTGNVSVNADFSVTGDSTLTGNVSASGDVNATGDVTADNISATTNGTIGGALSVAGASTLTGNVSAGSDITVVGDVSSANIIASNNANIGGNATVTGSVASASLNTTADCTIGGNLSVSGTTALAGTSTAQTPSADDNSTKIATTEYVQTEIKPIETDVTINDKRITNIEKLLQGNLYDYQTDNSSAYTKSVPSGAMPYAGLEKVGGKTLVMNQLVDYTSIASSGSKVGKFNWVNNNDGSFTFTGNSSAQTGNSITFATIPINHKYAVVGWTNSYHLGIFPNAQPVAETDGIFTQPNNNPLVLRSNVADLPDNVSVTLKPKIADLTLMFGAGNEPSTLDEFLAVFPDFGNEDYNAGTLLSAGVTDVVSNGANLIPTYTTSGSENGLTWTVSEDGSITINGTATNGTPIFAPISSWQWDGRTPCWLSGCPNGGSTDSYFLDIYGEDEWGAYQISEGDIGNGVILQPRSNSNNISNIPLRFRIVIISGTQCNNLTFKPILNYGTSAATYAPYIGTISTYSIPASIQALEGYGWSCPDHYNYIDYEAKKFVQEVGSRAYASGDESDSTVITDGTTTYYPLNPAIETDISAYITDDNLIQVESGGTITFPNSNGTEYQIPVPSAETFMIDLQEALS